MGFRSMMMTADFGVEWSPEFIAKHEKWINIPTSPNGKRIGALSSKHETKFYSSAREDVIQDIAMEVRRDLIKDSEMTYEVVLLHECGGITKFDIRQDRVDTLEPESWRLTDEIQHSYCYGCSENNPSEKP
jgi:hypothetical protein